MLKYMIIYHENGVITGIKVGYHDETIDYVSDDPRMLESMSNDFNACFPEKSKVKIWSDDTRDFWTYTIVSPAHYYYNYC